MASHHAEYGLVYIHSVFGKNRTHRPIQGRACFPITDLGSSFGGAGLHQIALILNHQICGGRADTQFLFLRIQRLLLKNALLPCRFETGASFLYGDLRVSNLQTDLLFQLRQANLLLPHLQLVARYIGARRPIANGNVDLHARTVIREIAAEDLRECVAIAAGQIRICG
jgi:hypothetical protein